MRRYVLGDTPGVDAWRMETVPDGPLGPGEVRVEMRAWSLNYRDLLVAKGKYGGKYVPGRVPLSDGAGEVVEVGAGVTDFKVGEHVANCFFREWTDGDLNSTKGKSAFGGGIDGVFAERVVLPASTLVHAPER